MKLKIKKSDLASGLEKVSGIVATRTSLPILYNVLVVAKDNALSMLATDLENRVIVELPADVKEPGEVTMPVKKFIEVLRDVRDEELNLETEQNTIRVNFKNGYCVAPTLPAEDFPKFDEFAAKLSFKMPQIEFSRMLKSVSYAALKDDSRKTLNGVFVSLKQSVLVTVATDGKRLALFEKQVENLMSSDGDSIITLKTAVELERLLGTEGDVIAEIGENMVSFKIGNTIITSKLQEGTYPNYKQVIPTSFTKKAELNITSLLVPLRLVSAFASESQPFVKFLLTENSMLLTANSPENGYGEERVEINYPGSEIGVSFNPKFLVDPLKAMDADKVVFQFNDGYSPVMLSTGGDEFSYVIMPIRK